MQELVSAHATVFVCAYRNSSSFCLRVISSSVDGTVQMYNMSDAVVWHLHSTRMAADPKWFVGSMQEHCICSLRWNILIEWKNDSTFYRLKLGWKRELQKSSCSQSQRNRERKRARERKWKKREREINRNQDKRKGPPSGYNKLLRATSKFPNWHFTVFIYSLQ